MISAILVSETAEPGRMAADYLREHGEFRLVEHTDRGQVAIQAVLGLKPDLVICEDLPELSSEALLEAVSSYAPETYFLILGSEPAPETLLRLLRLGAGDILPAPWNEAQLIEALDRFARRFSNRKQETSAEHGMQLRRVLDKKFFEDTVVTRSGDAILTDFEAIDYEYQLPFTAGTFQSLYLLIDPRPREALRPDAFLPMIELESQTRAFFSQYCHLVVCYVQDHGLSVLLNSPQPISGLVPLCREFLAHCTRELAWYRGPNTITIGIGLSSGDAREIPHLVESAKFAGWMRLSQGRGRILEFSKYYEDYHPNHDYLPHAGADALRRSVKALDEAFCRDVINETLDRAENAGAFVACAISINDTLIEAFNSYADTTVVENSKYLRLAKNMPPMVEKLDTLEQIRREVLRWAGDCIQILQSRALEKEDQAIYGAKQYISAHYTAPLHLEDVARQVNLTPSYFCMKFRQATGQNFVEYVTALRLERAKDLLRHSSRKIHEIAEAVGFTDTRHFSRTFRRYCGILPTQYRTQQRKN